MNRICTVCARGGSKGVVNKNIRPMHGKPLIAHTIDQAKTSGLFSTIAVSSDSDEILNAAAAAGPDLLIERPAELATDSSAKLPAIQHCVAEVESRTGAVFDTMVDLDATAPLRVRQDIAGAVALAESQDCSNVVTGCPAHRSPYFNLVEAADDGFVRLAKPTDPPILRRQDAPVCYDLNASIYVWPRAAFFEAEAVLLPHTLLYEMPAERSHDIDTELDFELVSILMSRLAAA